jgi:DNA-binding response OmpR family regulator
MTRGLVEADQLAILVVDDDPAMISLIAEAMLRDDHLVVTATSAEKGLEQLPYYTFHVAFIDHRLPEMEGIVFAGYLRENNPEMQVALVTGESAPRVREEAREHGITFIRKPFELADLYAVVDTYRQRVAERLGAEHNLADPHFAPLFAEIIDELPAIYGLAGVSSRISDGIAKRIKESLNQLRTGGRYNERDRLIALAGLLTARVLGLDLPRVREGETLYDQYDAIMHQHGRRTEFR